MLDHFTSIVGINHGLDFQVSNEDKQFSNDVEFLKPEDREIPELLIDSINRFTKFARLTDFNLHKDVIESTAKTSNIVSMSGETILPNIGKLYVHLSVYRDKTRKNGDDLLLVVSTRPEGFVYDLPAQETDWLEAVKIAYNNGESKRRGR
jgi:hypothetical protein